MCDNDETDVYKRNMYNFIVATKEDSGHLVLEEKREYMVRKHNFLKLMFEHTTNKIYDYVTKKRCQSLLIDQREAIFQVQVQKMRIVNKENQY